MSEHFNWREHREWEDKEHGKIVAAVTEGFTEVRSDIKDLRKDIREINEDRWKAKGVIIFLGTVSGTIGAFLFKHLMSG